MPDWAKELKAFIEKYAELKGFINTHKDFGLDEKFVEDSKLVLKKCDDEIKHRKYEEEIQKS